MEDLIPIIIFIILSIIFGGKKKKNKNKQKTEKVVNTVYFDKNGNMVKSSNKNKPAQKKPVSDLKEVLRSFQKMAEDASYAAKKQTFSKPKANQFTEKIRTKRDFVEEKSVYEKAPNEVFPEVYIEETPPVREHRTKFSEENPYKDIEIKVKKKTSKHQESFLKSDLSGRNGLRKAILLKEILGECKAASF